MLNDLIICNMTRSEVGELVDWAAGEGWNPGLHDADIFWQTDREAFIAAKFRGEFIGGGAITSYDGLFGFMGFFIVRPEFRGKGLGNSLWHARKERLVSRLRDGASIGMDGVFNMQDYYANGGFVFSHRDIRYQHDGPAPTAHDESILALDQFPFDEVLAYDNDCFPAPRPRFLRAWVEQPDALALGCLRHGRLSGYGVVRRCAEGCKIGPLFADDQGAAMALFAELSAGAGSSPVFLDVPENNSSAMQLARQYGMREVFGCARMYLGPVPEIAHERVFGVTTFELG